MEFDIPPHAGRSPGAITRHSRWILATAGICSLVAFVVGHFQPKTYKATAFLMVSENRISTDAPTAPYTYTLMSTYTHFADNDILIADAIQNLHLDQPPYKLDVDSFRSRGYLDITVPRLSKLLEIEVTFPDARTAAALANFVAQEAVKINESMTSRQTLNTRAFLDRQREETRKHLLEAQSARLKVRQKDQVESKEKQLAILLAEKTEISARLSRARLEGAQKDVEAQTLNSELAVQPPTIDLKQGISNDPMVQKAEQIASAGKSKDWVVTQENLNAAHAELEVEYAETLTSAAGAKAIAREGEARLRQLNGEIPASLADVTLSRSEVGQADKDYFLAGSAYETAEKDYQNASLAVTSSSPDLRQMGTALIPRHPSGPHVLLNALLVGLICLVLASAAALIGDRYQREKVLEFDYAGESSPEINLKGDFTPEKDAVSRAPSAR